jgi:hypothetical protein
MVQAAMIVYVSISEYTIECRAVRHRGVGAGLSKCPVGDHVEPSLGGERLYGGFRRRAGAAIEQQGRSAAKQVAAR